MIGVSHSGKQANFEDSVEGFYLAPGHCKLKLSVCLFFFFPFLLSFLLVLSFQSRNQHSIPFDICQTVIKRANREGHGVSFSMLLLASWSSQMLPSLPSSVTAPLPPHLLSRSVPTPGPPDCHKEAIVFLACQKMAHEVFEFERKISPIPGWP